MKKIALFLLLISSLLFAQNIKKDSAQSKEKVTKEELLEQEQEKEELRVQKIDNFLKDLKNFDDSIARKNSVWIKSYSSYITSLDVKKNLHEIKKRVDELEGKTDKSSTESEELNLLTAREKIVTAQLDKLKKKDASPFSNLLVPPNIDKQPIISNPIDIFAGISFKKTINKDYNDYMLKKDELSELTSLLRSQIRVYKELENLGYEGDFKNDYSQKQKQLDMFRSAFATMSVTAEVYEKRVDMLDASINQDIESQIMKLFKIGIIVLVVFLIFFLLKQFVKKYITDHQRFYMANKIITFVNFTIIILILFFSYIENVSYLVTILGFASAGIAIAMKDWFMSMLGWLVIVFGGSVHVGDRIRVTMDGVTYVGDVMDISLLRVTIMEDVTWTTLAENRRAGRVVFIPNNYVFTRMISNYTHNSLKTVWDGIDIVITFESNHKKAVHISREIAKKFSKGYTDITRKQLNKLRSNYSLKNTNVEPRIFTLVESNGIKVSVWYLTNAYATLTLRSVISTEIVDAFLKEDDITIAYPTQMMHMEKSIKKEFPPKTDEVV